MLRKYLFTSFSDYFNIRIPKHLGIVENDFYDFLDFIIVNTNNFPVDGVKFKKFCKKVLFDLKENYYSDHDISELNNIMLFRSIVNYTAESFIDNPILSIDWSYDNKSSAILSTGEESILSFYSRFFQLIRKKKLKNNILVFLDEPDVSLHPSMQLSLLNNVIIFFNTIFEGLDNNVQLFVTSHSPFIVSDLPVDNVIHLHKDVNGKSCISPMKEKEERTFAANIYDLYRSSFLLMGEGRTTISDFSRNKINQLLDRLSLLKSNPNLIEEYESDKIKEFIDMIGEPLIRLKLEELYFDIFKTDEDGLLRYYQDKIDSLKRKQDNNDPT